jgi:hypothetical protein
MYRFILPKTAPHQMDNGRRKFFWQGGHLKKKISSSEMAEGVQI